MIPRYFVCTVFLFSLLILSCNNVFYDCKIYSVNGTTLNNGERLSEVTVTLSGKARRGKPISFSTNTNNDGEYLFEEIPNGTYTITPSKESFAFTPSNRTVTIDSGEITVEEFTVITNTKIWSKTFGGSKDEKATSIQQTSDGGFIISGWTRTYTDDPVGNSEAWVIKLDKSGASEWNQTYGGVATDHFDYIKQTPDGGYIAAGDTGTLVFKNFSLFSISNFYIVKLNSSGVAQWEKTYGGAEENDEAKAIDTTSDGGCIVAGYTRSYGSGGTDFWILKLDSSGSMEWQEFFGGTGDETPRTIQQTLDGGYIVGGYTTSFGSGSDDMWILKLDSSGQLEWEYLYGGVRSDRLWSMQETSDGGYIAAGYTYSFNPDGSISPGTYSNGVIFKLNESGTTEWSRIYEGETGNDTVRSISLCADGGYIASGSYTVPGNGLDAWILKLDSSGLVQWEKKYGGAGADEANSIIQTSDGGYALGGYTSSYSNGGEDLWLLKLDPEGNYQ
ncbi:MAG: carboxypeptidase regulatory-like domain-containing protein [bacterium]|nr:carboxypeptidase regulatory-like domain-containing protein [bacterium]